MNTSQDRRMLLDDIIVKSRDKGDHLADLKRVFDIMRAHQLKMNPTKSFLGVASDKFFGFVVTSNCNHFNLEKVRAIEEMHPPRTLKELRGLSERLAYMQRFISNLSRRCQSFTLIYLGQCLLRSVRGNQVIPHPFICPDSSSIRKALRDIY